MPDETGGLRVPHRVLADAAQVGNRVSAVRASTAAARVRPSPAAVAPPGVA